MRRQLSSLLSRLVVPWSRAHCRTRWRRLSSSAWAIGFATVASGQVLIDDESLGNVVTLDDGTSHEATTLVMGSSTWTLATISGTGTSYTFGGSVTVGVATWSSLTVTENARLVANGLLLLGDQAFGGGILEVQNGGQVDANGGLVGGSQTSSGATINISGAGTELRVAGFATLGHEGSATVTLASGGRLELQEGAIGGRFAGSVALLSGSELVVSEWLGVGHEANGTGILEASGGSTFQIGESLALGNSAGASGALELSGEGTAGSVTGYLTAGNAGGTGSVVVSQGAELSVLAGGGLDGSVFVGAASGTSESPAGTVLVSGRDPDTLAPATWSIAGTLNVGNNGYGTVDIADHAIVTAAGVWAPNGRVEVATDAQLNVSGQLYLGSGATFITDGGWFSALDLVVAGGTVTLNQGMWVTQVNGSAYWTITAGGTVNHAGLSFAPVAGPSVYALNSYTLVDGGSLVGPGNLEIGLNGTAWLEARGGSQVTGQVVAMGKNAGAEGTFRVLGSGTTASFTDSIIVGGAGVGTLRVEESAQLSTDGWLVVGQDAGAGRSEVWGNDSGAIVVGGGIDVGSLPGAEGLLALDQQATVTVADWTLIGNGGTGDLSLGNGSTFSGLGMIVGNEAGSTGGVVLFGGSELSLQDGLLVGSAAGSTGSIVAAGADVLVEVGGYAYIGDQGGGSAHLSGGARFEVTQAGESTPVLVIGYRGGDAETPGGTFVVTGVNEDTNTRSTVAVDGAILVGGTGFGEIQVTDGALMTATEWVSVSQGRVRLEAGGELTAPSFDLYAGSLELDGGVLTTTFGAGFDPGTTVVGSGTFVGPTVFYGGTIAADGAAGQIEFIGGLHLMSGTVLEFELGAALSDLLVVSGGLLTGPDSGTLTLHLLDLGGFDEGVYTLFDFSSGGTTLSDFDLHDFHFGNTIAGFDYELAIHNNTLQLTAFSAVPEPSTYALLFSGIAGVAAGARRWSGRSRRTTHQGAEPV